MTSAERRNAERVPRPSPGRFILMRQDTDVDTWRWMLVFRGYTYMASSFLQLVWMFIRYGWERDGAQGRAAR